MPESLVCEPNSHLKYSTGRAMSQLPRSTPTGAIEALLSEARCGSKEALGRALDGCRKQLLRAANEFIRIHPEIRRKVGASDLVQDSIMQAHLDFEQFRGNSEGEWWAWIRQILVRKAINFMSYIHAHKRDIRLEGPLEGSGPVPGDALAVAFPSPSSAARRCEEAEALERAMESLPSNYRQVVVLRYKEQLSFKDIAAATGRTLDATHQLWFRGLRLLAEKLR
jgi:RNA polymerase sigma-70 factor (ECF subfamily)